MPMPDSDAVRETAVLDAPPAAVWAVLMDPRRLEEWVSAHRKLDDLPALPLGTGDGFRQRLGVGPVGFWVDWKILEADEPKLARWCGSGPGGSTADVTYELTEVEGGKTRFDYTNDFTPPGGMLGKTAKRAVNSAVGSREARKSLEALGELFSGDGSGPG
jgi:uncharacterized protein YndB with AHSA1/START domain